jgi:hypothetical protein
MSPINREISFAIFHTYISAKRCLTRKTLSFRVLFRAILSNTGTL